MRSGKDILDFEYYLQCVKQSGFTGPIIMHGLEEMDVPFARYFLRQTLASVHKDLRLCDLCKELAFGHQCVNGSSRDSYNSLEFNVLWRQFLESTPLGLRHLLRERNFSSGRRLWCNGVWQSRRRKPRPTDQWCFEKPVGEHGSFGFAMRALVRPGSDPCGY